MKSELGIARSAVFGLGFRLERDEATTEDPDQEGSEQPWIEGEGHGFAEGDLLEVWMRGIEQVVRLCVNDHAWQLQHDGACVLHPPVTDLHAGRRRRFLGPVSRQVRRGDGLQQRLVKLDRDGHLLECHWRISIRFEDYAARVVSERLWHSSQSIRKLEPDGSVIEFQATLSGLEEITRWVLSWGSKARVLGPPELVQRVREELEKAIELNC